MEHVADIPVPQPGDSETVISMLETAAAFSAKGDAVEALSWLKRATESASEGGDDGRTLALARSVSSLADRLRAPGALLGAAAPLGAFSTSPKPPPRPSSTSPVASEPLAYGAPEDAAEATPRLPVASVENTPVSARPPPPSSRAVSALPKPPSSSRAAASRPSASMTATPVSPGPAKSGPVASPSAAPARELSSARDAARVSIVKSSTEPGLYYVRLLEDGKRATEGFEGLLVSLEPDARLR